jgi:hypothetical protein
MIEQDPYRAPATPLAAPPTPAAETSAGRDLLRLLPWSVLVVVAILAAALGPMLAFGFEVCLPSVDCQLKNWARHAVVVAMTCLVYRGFLRRTSHRHGLWCVALFVLVQAMLMAPGIAARGWELTQAQLVLVAIHVAGAAIAFFTFHRPLRLRAAAQATAGT